MRQGPFSQNSNFFEFLVKYIQEDLYIFSYNTQATSLEYYEWVDQKDIPGPFTKDILEKLKRIIETKSI